jgi:hypothetical protein
VTARTLASLWADTSCARNAPVTAVFLCRRAATRKGRPSSKPGQAKAHVGSNEQRLSDAETKLVDGTMVHGVG